MTQLMRAETVRKWGYKIHWPARRHTATDMCNAPQQRLGKACPRSCGGEGGGFWFEATHE
jgi:hypothetical protein